MMDAPAIVLMILVLGFTWGGIIYFINLAYKREKRTSGRKG